MTGRPDYDVGDLVECVDASPCPIYGPVPGLALGNVYRVVEVKTCKTLTGQEEVGVKTDRHNPTRGDVVGYSHHTRFRKVRSLPESLTQLLATDAPVRIREDA